MLSVWQKSARRAKSTILLSFGETLVQLTKSNLYISCNYQCKNMNFLNTRVVAMIVRRESRRSTLERRVKATSMPWTAGTLTRSSYIDTNTSDGLRLGLKFGARRLVSDGVCRMACINGWDCSGLLRINSWTVNINNTQRHYRLTNRPTDRPTDWLEVYNALNASWPS